MIPASPDKGDGGGRWETVRYALDSNARTVRFCLMSLVLILPPAVLLALLRHLLLPGAPGGAALPPRAAAAPHGAAVMRSITSYSSASSRV